MNDMLGEVPMGWRLSGQEDRSVTEGVREL